MYAIQNEHDDNSIQCSDTHMKICCIASIPEHSNSFLVNTKAFSEPSALRIPTAMSLSKAAPSPRSVAAAASAASGATRVVAPEALNVLFDDVAFKAGMPEKHKQKWAQYFRRALLAARRVSDPGDKIADVRGTELPLPTLGKHCVQAVKALGSPLAETLTNFIVEDLPPSDLRPMKVKIFGDSGLNQYKPEDPGRTGVDNSFIQRELLDISLMLKAVSIAIITLQG